MTLTGQDLQETIFNYTYSKELKTKVYNNTLHYLYYYDSDL